jgi:hypothetical protein
MRWVSGFPLCLSWEVTTRALIRASRIAEALQIKRPPSRTSPYRHNHSPLLYYRRKPFSDPKSGGVRILDEGQGWSVHGQDTLAGECRSCVIAQRLTGERTRSVAPCVAEDDDDVVVISEPGLDGLVVIPRQHIGGLDDLSVLGRAHLLAALRRVTQSVQERNPGSATRIVIMTHPPATKGHMCFYVAPSDSEESEIAPSGRG